MRTAPGESQAKNNPAARQFSQPELSTTDLPRRTLDPVEDVTADREDILVADTSDVSGDYLKELAFMNEPVTILLHRGREKNAPTHEMVGVNGRIMWVPVDTPTRLPRCFVEVLARAQPMSVNTRSGEADGDSLTYNVVDRSLSSLVSFSVLEDKNPKGAAWLTRVMREG